MGPVCSLQAVQDLEDGNEWLSRNVGNYESTLGNISEEQRAYLHSAGRFKSREANLTF